MSELNFFTDELTMDVPNPMPDDMKQSFEEAVKRTLSEFDESEEAE
ncbi:hypothetical protein [Butyrivibrio sp. AC2005]|nr:hypothetical protein [Butyrivibrio sp. AC2005]